MITITATKLRNNLFEFLARVSKGETISVQRNGEEVARIIPAKKKDWRDNVSTRARLLVPADEAFAPMEDIWEDYI